MWQVLFTRPTVGTKWCLTDVEILEAWYENRVLHKGVRSIAKRHSCDHGTIARLLKRVEAQKSAAELRQLYADWLKHKENEEGMVAAS